MAGRHEPPALQQTDRTYVLLNGRKLSYFSGCDYYRMATHPAVLEAVRLALDRFGLNVAASRMTTGNHALYERLEGALATFFDANAALLFPTGYLCPSAVTQAFADEVTCAFIDERAHMGLIDATKFLKCPVHIFAHRNAGSLGKLLRKERSDGFPLLLTDGMFSHDGSAAPLEEYLDLLPRSGWLLVDDAHGAGVLGGHGRGTLEYAGVGRGRIIQTITLSKAFGSYGGAVLGSKTLRRRLITKCPVFTGSTPVPLPLMAGALAAVQVLTDDPMHARLHRNSRYLKEELERTGLNVANTPGPIVTIAPLGTRKTTVFAKVLLDAGIYPPVIKYMQSNARFRFVVSSEHTQEQLDSVVRAFDKASSLFPP